MKAGETQAKAAGALSPPPGGSCSEKDHGEKGQQALGSFWGPPAGNEPGC